MVPIIWEKYLRRGSTPYYSHFDVSMRSQLRQSPAATVAPPSINVSSALAVSDRHTAIHSAAAPLPQPVSLQGIIAEVVEEVLGEEVSGDQDLMDAGLDSITANDFCRSPSVLAFATHFGVSLACGMVDLECL